MMDRFYLCSHTHWDREWYGSFEQFRIRLVKMIDSLLDIFEKDPGFKCFNFDGQTIVIEDYLEIRPENEPLLRRYIQEGRLVIGPWFVLPDEFLVSGEAIIRNLMFGDAIGRKYGKTSSVGYLPDMFGHISQMPQLLKQWGMEVVILWRGLSGDEYKNELLWQSPDGSTIVLSHIPEEFGYITAALYVGSLTPEKRVSLLAKGLHPNDMVSGGDAVDAIVEACSYIKDKALTYCHILFNGIDHMPANPEIPELIKGANLKLKDGEIIHSSFDEYAEALLKATSGKELQVVKGELRNTMWTDKGAGIILNGILSSRIYLKQQNQRCCTLLENWVEPFSVFNALTGGKFEREFIDKAWRFVLENHPHDSIGGCSADIVHRHMETRFEFAQEIAENLLEFTFTEILEKVKIEGIEDGEYAFAVFNPSQEKQSGWMKLELEIPWSMEKKPPAEPFKGIVITDMAGREQPSWLVAHEPDKPVNRPSLRTFYVAPGRPVFTISFWAEDIPACGYKVFKFRPVKRPNCIFGNLSVQRNVLENEYLRAEIQANGTINLTEKGSGLLYKNLHYFEDGGDNGGGYAYSFPKDDQVYNSLSSNADVAIIENSRARAAYKVTLTFNLPEALVPSKHARSGIKKPLVVESIISLGTGSRRLDIETTVVNTIKEHRLRVVFPTYLNTDISSAEAQFDVVDHPIEIEQPPPDIWKEDQPKQFPQKAFVSVTDGEKGLTIANIGLPEYEVTPDKDRAVAITLLRAVSHLSNVWKNTRLYGAGCPMETPEAQMLGRKLVFNYSIIPHAGAWHESGVQKEAQNFVRGLKAFPVLYSQGAKGLLPGEFSFISVNGDNVVLSSIKQCVDGEGYVLRLWNGSDISSVARISVFRRPERVYLSNIKEERLEQIPASETLEIPVCAKKIVTIRMEE